MLSTRLTIIALLAATQCLTSDAAGLVYDVACHGVNSELQCPPGQMIEVMEIHSGVESDADCTNRTKPATVFTGDSLQPGMMYLFKLVCNYLEHCRLPKPDVLFQHDNSDNHFIQINYHCHEKQETVITVVACENEIAEIQCENGKVQILNARFGRFDQTTCTKTPLNMSHSAGFPARSHVEDMCNGFGSCSVTASDSHLGKTVPRQNDDYLIVDYFCV